MAKATTKKPIEIVEIRMGTIKVHLLGTSALIMHRFAPKAWHELLLPSPEMNRAEKAANLKHDPVAEFREGMYLNRDRNEPAMIHFPSNAFGKALASAATDIPGATKAQMSRLTSIVTTQVNFFGVPEMFMAMVRNSGMNAAPDVRTRPIFSEWACSLEIRYVASLVKESQIVNLLSAAGIIVGLGDWRPQKAGSYGQFQVVSADNPDFVRITRTMGREAQRKAYNEPRHYDAETEELMAWFRAEVARREKYVPSVDTDADGIFAERKPDAADNARAKRAVVATKALKGKKNNGKHAS